MDVSLLRRVCPLVIVLVAAALGILGARAQNFDDGKTGPQLFATDCSACHRSPQGLAKTRSGGALADFLRQHYTSSSKSATTLAGYLASPGANPRADRQKAGAPDESQPKGRKKGETTTAAHPPEPTADHDKKSKKGDRAALDPAGKLKGKSRKSPPAETAARPPETSPPDKPAGETPAATSETPATAPPPEQPTTSPAATPPADTPTVVAAPAEPPAPPSPPKPPDQPAFASPLP